GDTNRDAPLTRFTFTESDVSQLRVREQAVRNEAVACAATAARQVVPDDAEVVRGDVGELRAAGTLADCPDAWRARLEPIVDADVAARLQLDAGQFEPDAVGVGSAPDRDQDIADSDGRLLTRRPHPQVNVLSTSSLNVDDVSREQERDAL